MRYLVCLGPYLLVDAVQRPAQLIDTVSAFPRTHTRATDLDFRVTTVLLEHTCDTSLGTGHSNTPERGGAHSPTPRQR